MNKTPAPVDLQEGGTAPAAAIPLSLQEFCMRLSETVKRPELISGFEHMARAGGLTSATQPEFQSAYDSFLNKPI